MQAPVEQGDAHGGGGRLVGKAGGERVARVMPHGFGNRPEDQSDAHAATEQHGDPGAEAELGFVVVSPKLHRPKLAAHQIDQ
ncbi:hypothetical protein D3C75_1210840 [compost metagenome]